MPQFSVEIRLDGISAVHNSPDYPETVQRLANSYRCPVGPYAGRAYVLMLRRDVLAISGRSTHTLSFVETPISPASALNIAKLYWITASHVTPGDPENPDGLYLVELADPRIIAERFSDTEDEIHRVRGQAVSKADPYLPTGAATTWQGLVNALWPSYLGTAPSLPYTPVGNPEGTHWHGESSWWALHAVLDDLGCTTAYDPVLDVFAIVRRGDVENLPSLPKPIFDAAPVEVATTDAPETIACYFPDWIEGFGLEDDTTPEATNWLLQPPYERKTGAGGGPAGTLPIWSDLPRVIAASGSTDNATDMTNRTTQYVESVLLDVETTREHMMFDGVLSELKPGANVKTVLWRHWGPAYGMVTEYVSHPGDPKPPAGKQYLEIPKDPWRPPELARRTYPTWPRVCQTVRAYDSGEDLGVALALEGDNYTPGEVIRHKYGAAGPAAKEDIWIRCIDNWDVMKGQVRLLNGGHFVARLCGIAYVSGASPATRPLYAVQSGGGSSGWIGKTKEVITAQSGNCPGTGTVELYYMNASDCLVVFSTMIEVEVWNMCGAIDSGVWVQGKYIDGYRFVDVVCCP